MSRSYSTLAGFGAERPQIVTGAADNDDSLPGCPMQPVLGNRSACYTWHSAVLPMLENKTVNYRFIPRKNAALPNVGM